MLANSDNQIIQILQNAGFHNTKIQSGTLYMEDPGCIIRNFETFMEYAWFIIVTITALLLFAWAVSMLRGAKNNIFANIKSIVLIFLTLSVVPPLLNVIYGDDIFAQACKQVTVPMSEIRELLELRKQKIADEQIEVISIFDSGQIDN